HLITHEKQEPAEVLRVLNSDSGLKGLSGVSNDMRDVLRKAKAGDARAALAVDTFCYRVRKYIGAYLAAMHGADALIFTGGIGENSAEVRRRICADMNSVGIGIEEARNSASNETAREIGASAVRVWVVPTNEELL